MPLRKKKISELNEASDFKGFYTIGYRLLDGVKESVKIGLEYIQTAYEKVVQATKDAVTATTDMRQLETTVEENEEARQTAESQRVAAEQLRKTAETERETKEAERIASEAVRVTSETERDTAETARKSAEDARKTAEEKRVSDFNEMQSNSEIATGAANAAAASANQAAITANTAADNADAKAALADTAASNANDTADHPTYIGADHYVYKWNKDTKAYDKTDIYTKGDAFSIKKVYPSVLAMEADVTNPDISVGDFVLVNTNDVENPDNAKLYVKGKNVDGSYSYSFLVDMSGAIGFTGKTPQFLVGTISTSEAGSEAQITISEDGTDTDGNPKYRLNFVIPRGNPGAPFQVKGQYATLEELQAAIPDGSTVEGFIAVGDKIPYDYYAWVNGAWVNQGKIINEEIGKMVLIPADVINLTNTSTSNEILDAFGGKEAFINIVTKVKEGALVALDAGGPLMIPPTFEGRIDESTNEYLLNFVIVNPMLQGTLSPIFGITLRGDVASLERNDNYYDYSNVVNIPLNVIFLTSESTSDQIITAFGGKENFNKVVNKVGIGSAVNTISGNISGMTYSMSANVILEEYTDANNLSLEIAYSSTAEYWANFSITVSNGIFSCKLNQIEMLRADRLVSDPSTGGTDRPASAEAVKTLNDTKVSSTDVRAIQRLTPEEDDALVTKDANTLYIVVKQNP